MTRSTDTLVKRIYATIPLTGSGKRDSQFDIKVYPNVIPLVNAASGAEAVQVRFCISACHKPIRSEMQAYGSLQQIKELFNHSLFHSGLYDGKFTTVIPSSAICSRTKNDPAPFRCKVIFSMSGLNDFALYSKICFAPEHIRD